MLGPIRRIRVTASNMFKTIFRHRIEIEISIFLETDVHSNYVVTKIEFTCKVNVS